MQSAAVRARTVVLDPVMPAAAPSASVIARRWEKKPPTLQDAMLILLERRSSLRFVQVGGFDGVSFDPLRPFIQGGRLSGLIIEPMPAPYAKLQRLYAGSTQIRLCHCAISDREGESVMWRFQPEAIEQGVLNRQFGGISSLGMDTMLADEGSLGRMFSGEQRVLLRSLIEPVPVACRTLPSLLAEHDLERIDLLQIDTEGHDLVILKSFDFARCKPAIVNYEHIHLAAADQEEAQALLTAHGYRLFPQDADTLAVIEDALAPPPRGADDGFQGADFDGVRGNVIFCAWTGSNPLTANRAEALLSIYRETGCPVMFLNNATLRRWEKPDAPFHPAFEFLSETHRADYLRCYLMHFYGGGYTDLKHTAKSWSAAFELLRASPRAVGIGYQELGPQSVAPCGEPLESILRENAAKLIGNCAYIFRKNSAFTTRWLAATHALLDGRLERLRAHPARHPMDQTGVQLPDGSVSAYPLRWTEMLGDIFHPLVYEFHDTLIQADLMPSFQNYR